MGERLIIPAPERQVASAEKPAHEESHRPRHELTEAETRHEYQEALKDIQAVVEHEAVSSQNVLVDSQPEPPALSQLALTKRHINQAYKHTLGRVRKHLPAQEKVLSRFIHQPLVENLSRAGEQSVARPSGLLGGSLVAFIGSGLLLYFAKHYGYHYNFFGFVVLFAAGFAIGVLVELLARLVLRRRAAAK